MHARTKTEPAYAYADAGATAAVAQGQTIKHPPHAILWPHTWPMEQTCETRHQPMNEMMHTYTAVL